MIKITLCFLSLFCINFSFAQEAESYYRKALEYKEKQDYASALTAINNALRLDPLQVNYLSEKGSYLKELKSFQEAFDVYTKAIGIKPNESSLYIKRAGLMATVQQFDEAIVDLTKALELTPVDSMK
jgi:tetratricopeptide (TPR) repeat protein